MLLSVSMHLTVACIVDENIHVFKHFYNYFAVIDIHSIQWTIHWEKIYTFFLLSNILFNSIVFYSVLFTFSDEFFSYLITEGVLYTQTDGRAEKRGSFDNTDWTSYSEMYARIYLKNKVKSLNKTSLQYIVLRIIKQ